MEVVEKRIREEYNRKPAPIYVMGESFGGCLALSVAARNPDLDIVLVIANPGTSDSWSVYDDRSSGRAAEERC